MRPAATAVRAGKYPSPSGDSRRVGISTICISSRTHLRMSFRSKRAAAFLALPQQAMWIPAGVAHRTTLAKVRNVSIFFDPEMIDKGDRVRVFPAIPVLREMAIYARRWPLNRTADDVLAGSGSRLSWAARAMAGNRIALPPTDHP